MTMLLKSVWRNVLRSGQISKTSLVTCSLSSTVSEVSRSKSPDAVMVSLRSAETTAAVLNTIQTQLPFMDHTHMIQALRTIFELQKANKSKESALHLIKDPAFSVLCQNINKHARSLDVNEAIDTAKVLIYLQIPVDSLIVQTMLQLIRCNINMINLRQVMFLDFLLSRFDTKNHLVDALKLALPLVFQIHLPLELDTEDLPLLKDMLAYACTHDMPDRCKNNIITGLLLNDEKINASMARSIIWSLCEINCTEERFPTRVQLLHKCFDVLSRSLDELSYDDVLRTVAIVKGCVVEKHMEYYNEGFIDAVGDYVVRNGFDFEKTLLVARVFSRMAHTHLRLIKYLCDQSISSPTTLSNAKVNAIFGLVNCLSNNNYIPDDKVWTEMKRQMSENPVMDGSRPGLPWVKFCLELASLDHFDDRLLEIVLCPDFLKTYLEREKNILDHVQFLTLYEAVITLYSDKYKLPEDILEPFRASYPLHRDNFKSSLKGALQRGLGGDEYVAQNVQLTNGFIADCLICLKNGVPTKLKDNHGDRTTLDSLNIPPESTIICVLKFHGGCFSMNSDRLRGTFYLVQHILEKQGYLTVALNENKWLLSPPHERTPYLMREITHKCAEIGQKLSAT